MINRLINELMYYAVSEHLVDEDDKVFVTNSLLALFNQVEFREEEIKEERSLADILKGYVNMGIGRWTIATVLTFGACLGIVFALNLLNIVSWVG